MSIATQALPIPDASQGRYRAGAFTSAGPSGVQNVYNLLPIHRQVFYGANQGAFLPNLVCKAGVAGVNSECLCPNSSDSMPFMQASASYTHCQFDSLFRPEYSRAFPHLTPAALYLVKQRSPLPKSEGSAYSALDHKPLL